MSSLTAGTSATSTTRQRRALLRRVGRSIACAAAVLIVACGGGGGGDATPPPTQPPPAPPPPPAPSLQCVVSSMATRPGIHSMAVGDSVVIVVQASATSCGAPVTTWRSEDTTVASVSTTSDPLTVVARGRRAGRTGIRVSLYNFSVATDLTVMGAAAPIVSTVTISPATATLTIGQRGTLSATARDAAGSEVTGRPVQWSSDRIDVATVSATGVVTAVAAGTANVTATVDGARGTARVSVSAPAPAGVRLTPAFQLLAVGGTATLTAADDAGAPLGAPPLSVASRNAGIVSVTGLAMRGVASGVTDVVATNGAASDSARVAVASVGGFAVLVSRAPDQVRATAAQGSTLTLDVLVRRPPGATGGVGSIAGSIRWDAAQLQLQSSTGVEPGWSWTPNASAGTLTFAAFSTAETAASFTLARLTFLVTGTASGTPRVITPSVTAAGSATGQSLTSQAVAVPTAVIVQ